MENEGLDLHGKVAIVTGSGRGLGLAFAQALCKAGASVVVNDVDAGAVDEAVASLIAAGGKAVGEAVAVGSSEAAERLVIRAVDAFGRLDIMVCNAGILRDRVMWNMTDAEFDAVIETHLRGTFTCARAAVHRMKSQGEGGRLILVASPAGQRGNFGQTNYAAAKAGIAAFARTWAMECARANITVNAMVPTAMTAMVASIPGMEAHAAAVAEGRPLPKTLRQGMGMGTAEDVAPLAVFLASARGSSITGQCIGIGGDKLSLWSHPQEVRMAYRDGGWDLESIANGWETSVGQELQSYGIAGLQQ